MATYTLTLVDVRRVQNYLFNANELRQNLGASLLVERVTGKWMGRSLPPNNNLDWEEKKVQPLINKKTIDGDNLDAEVIFMGGGNVAILFISRPEAEAFTRRYTRKVLQKVPGLDIAVAHTSVDWDQEDGLEQAWYRMQTETMPSRKEGRAHSQALPGLAVTAECTFTGTPVVEDMLKLPGTNETRVLVSAEVQAKRNPETVQAAKHRLVDLLPPGETFDYTDDLEKLGGEKGRSRYIAVVHADGNEMGKRIHQYLENVSGNRERIDAWRLFSDELNYAGLQAMETVMDWVRRMPQDIDRDTKAYIVRDRWDPNATLQFDTFLPVRPIVFGGDDITFVCEGRLGIALAVKFLQAFHQNKLPDGEQGYACAGVAIVHHNYPFARAYKLAEELAQNAKKQAQEYDANKQVSLIHWHISTSGLALDWDEIHRREFQIDRGDGNTGDIILRPLVVNKAKTVQAQETGWRTWEVFEKQVEVFRTHEDWKGRRNKLKELREIYQQEPGAIKDFTHMHGNLPAVIENQTDYKKTGLFLGRGVYFDALDAEDWLIYPPEGKEVAPDA